MFTDAHYQPHSSSVTVAALAAMSPTTPTHLVLPPHIGRGGVRGEEGLKCSTSFQDADGGCWPFTPCFCTINREGSCAIIYLLDPPPPTHSHHHVWDTAQHLYRVIAPVPLPFAMWKQPFSRGHFFGFHPDAWHSWQIGCGSEGDGLWKQCPCLHPTHCRHIHKGRLTRRYMTAALVRTQSHTQRS